MDDKIIGAALIELADLANCVSGDFHTLHLNVHGIEFDSIHSVLKTYYEEAADDYDELAEKARMFDILVPNKNGSATRIGYGSIDEMLFTRSECVGLIQTAMIHLTETYLQVYQQLNKIDTCIKSVGISNFLQTRIEYWSKELCFFNNSRADVGE